MHSDSAEDFIKRPIILADGTFKETTEYRDSTVKNQVWVDFGDHGWAMSNDNACAKEPKSRELLVPKSYSFTLKDGNDNPKLIETVVYVSEGFLALPGNPQLRDEVITDFINKRSPWFFSYGERAK